MTSKIVEYCKRFWHNVLESEIEEFIEQQLRVFDINITDVKEIFYPLCEAIVQDIKEKSKSMDTSVIDVVTMIDLLPRKLLTFTEECLRYFHLLKINCQNTDRYHDIMHNCSNYIINYLVYLHGIYILKSVDKKPQGLTPEQYFGNEISFSCDEQRDLVFMQYSVPVRIILLKFLK